MTGWDLHDSAGSRRSRTRQYCGQLRVAIARARSRTPTQRALWCQYEPTHLADRPESVHDLIALLERLGVRCDLTKRDAVYYATNATAVEGLRREFRLRLQSGLEAEWLSAGELRRMTGIAGQGAIHTRGSAQFDPYRACVGVLRFAVVHSTDVFERSEVRRIHGGRDGVRLHGQRYG
jgi:FAD dependent oxidoreductase